METRKKQVRELRDRLAENKADEGLMDLNEQLSARQSELEGSVGTLQRQLAEKEVDARKAQTDLESANSEIRRMEGIARRNDEEIVTLRYRFLY